MTQEDIAYMAWTAGFNKTELAYLGDNFVRFAELVAAAENEACAKAADEHMQECEGKSFGVGAAIRARGQA
jgi:hypothetical protein